jgi:hypothetical protein
MVVALTVALAGCGGGGGTATPGDDGDGAASDGNADGSADPDGSDESNGGAPTATAAVDGTATMASTPTATGTMSGAETPTSTPNASGPSETDESVGPLLEDVIRSPDQFRYRVETSVPEGTYVQVGRWHGDDFYGNIESIAGMEQSYEVYSVDGEIDTVIGGQCIDMGSQQVQNPRNTSQEDQNLSTRPVGTDTIDGESVYVYEVETEEPVGTMTYYVDTESGYVVRMEYMQTTYEYWDFGNVEPVESPC